MNQEIELLPCPFCGSDAIHREHLDNRPYRYGIGCTKCLCEHMGHLSIQSARISWNTRYSKQAQVLDEHRLIMFLTAWGINRTGQLGKDICQHFGINKFSPTPGVTEEEIVDCLMTVQIEGDIDEDKGIYPNEEGYKNLARAIKKLMEGGDQ